MPEQKHGGHHEQKPPHEQKHEQKPQQEQKHEQASAAQPEQPGEKIQGELMIKVKAKSLVVVRGVTHKEGEIFELPEREALGLVGTGDAEEVPGAAPGQE